MDGVVAVSKDAQIDQKCFFQNQRVALTGHMNDTRLDTDNCPTQRSARFKDDWT